jgi:hypothetical protein
MLQNISSLRSHSSQSVDDIGIFANRMDLKDIATDCYKRFASRPRAVGHFLPLILKADVKAKLHYDKLQTILKNPNCAGQALSDAVLKFVAQFLSQRQRETHSFVGVAAVVICLAEFRDNTTPAMSTAFERSFKTLKYIRHYSSCGMSL